MSDEKTKTVDERYVILQYENVKTQLDNITKTLDTYVKDLRKMLDDHEQRLRQQAEKNAANAQLIMAQKLEVKDLANDVTQLKIELTKRVDEVVSTQKEQKSRELSMWQNIGVEAVKYLLFGSATGGTFYALLELVGKF